MRDSSLPRLALLLGLAATTLTGCGSPSQIPTDFGESAGPSGGFSGGITEPGPGTEGPFAGQGRALFLKTVAPALEQSCASCHASENRSAPVFMASTAESTYVSLGLYGGMIAPAVNSRLLQQGTHAGPDLPAEQRQLVARWLDVEVSERGLFPGGRSLEQALGEVGNCMSHDDWTANGLDGLSEVKTLDGQACSACHSSGDSGVFVDADPQKTFEGNRQFPAVRRWVRGDIDSKSGSLAGLDPAGVLASYGKEFCDSTTFDGCHLAYELPASLELGIQAFSNATIKKWETGACLMQ